MSLPCAPRLSEQSSHPLFLLRGGGRREASELGQRELQWTEGTRSKAPLSSRSRLQRRTPSSQTRFRSTLPASNVCTGERIAV